MGRRSEKIKHRKASQTLIKTRLFARAGKRIMAAAKSGGIDINSNHALYDAIEQAKSIGVPRSNIERILDKIRHINDPNHMNLFKKSVMEAYGKGGVGIYIELLTDNLNRAVMESRTVINKKGLKIATPGSVTYTFKRIGVVRIHGNNEDTDNAGDDDDDDDGDNIDEDELLETALELGAEDCEKDPNEMNQFRILIEPTQLSIMTKSLKEKGYNIQSSQVEMIPTTCVTCSIEDYNANMEAIDALEELLDVDGVYHTMALTF